MAGSADESLGLCGRHYRWVLQRSGNVATKAMYTPDGGP